MKQTFLEELEDRIAPATFTFADVDGDFVTVKTSKGTDAELTAILTLSVQGVGNQLQKIDFSSNTAFSGTDLTVTAKRMSNGGDGFVNVGYVDATAVGGGTNLNLGNIKIAGDLGRINAGNGDAAIFGVKSLNLQSMGMLGLTTQGAGASYLTEINGLAQSVVIQGDLRSVDFNLNGGTAGDKHLVSLIKIGGSVIGGSGSYHGDIYILNDDVSKILIGGSVVGGSGNGSAEIFVGGTLGEIQIGGSLISGSQTESGVIQSMSSIGKITIGQDVRGGSGSGHSIYSANGIKSVSIGGDLVGGSGANSGSIYADAGALDRVTVGGQVIGGSGQDNARIYAGLTIGSVKITGGLTAGSGDQSGAIKAQGNISSVWIGGTHEGSDKIKSASIESVTGNIASVTIGKDLRGGAGEESAAILATSGHIGKITIGGSVLGGGGERSAYIFADDGIDGLVKIGANLQGGSGVNSGTLQSDFISSVTIGGNLQGGSATSAGSIYSSLTIGTIKVTGSVIGGTESNTGSIYAGTDVTSISIGRDFRGGSATGGDALSKSGSILIGTIKTLTIGGSFYSGTDTTLGTFEQNGVIQASKTIGSLTIKGNIAGNGTNTVLITAAGTGTTFPKPDVAIGSIIVGGSVDFTRILAGYSQSGGDYLYGNGGANADAQIGAVKVNGSWGYSDLVAGVSTGADGLFGTPDDEALANGFGDLISKIASIAIKGQVFGPSGGGHNGFVAQWIPSFKVGSTAFPLLKNGGNDVTPGFNVGSSFGVTVQEVPIA